MILPDLSNCCASCQKTVWWCWWPLRPAQVADPAEWMWCGCTKLWQQPPWRLIVLYPAAEVNSQTRLSPYTVSNCIAGLAVGCPLAFFPSRVKFSFHWVSLAILSIHVAIFPQAGKKAHHSLSINKWSKVTGDLTEKNRNPALLNQNLEVLSLSLLTYLSGSINLRMTKEKLTTSLMKVYP